MSSQIDGYADKKTQPAEALTALSDSVCSHATWQRWSAHWMIAESSGVSL